MKKNLTKKIISIINSLVFLFIAKVTSAQKSIIDPTDPNSPDFTKYRQGNYELNDMVLLIIRASDLILRFVGSLALLFFIYGGIMFLLSSGNKEQVSKASGIIKAAVIGLIIVFASFIIISFALRAMGIDWDGGLIII